MKTFIEPIKKATPIGEQLTKAQNAQFDILKKFKNFCDKFQINYFLAADALKGAVENKDFIPGTCGVEVLMPTPDFGKFLSTIKKSPIEGLALNNFMSDGAYSLPFAKLFNDENGISTSIESDAEKNGATESGDPNGYIGNEYIAINVLDGMPRRKFSQAKRLFVYNLMLKKLNKKNILDNDREITLMGKIGLFFVGICFWYKSGNKLKRKIEAELKRCSYKYSNQVINLYGGKSYNTLPKEAYVTKSQVKLVTFRGVKFTAPYDIEAYFNSFVNPKAIKNAENNENIVNKNKNDIDSQTTFSFDFKDDFDIKLED